MATNFTAAVLAIMLVAFQLYCMGLYGNTAKDGSATAEKPAFSNVDNTLRSGSLMAEDTDLVLSYDLSSSPALINIDNAMK